MRKCANISLYLRRPFVIYDFATAPFLYFLIYEENFVFFFISVQLGKLSPLVLVLIGNAVKGNG
jgi:hypothetical protein